jgi:ferric-dicitrate binding protein FerR (iron transport regulator)
VAEFRTIATATGERRSVVLAQGIGVLLGPSTSLELGPEISGKRTVRLNGEAYFTVTHDQRRRLYVRTASALIEDIGTAFDVRALAGEARTDVAVVEGVVALRGTQGPTSDTVLNVSAGSMGTVDGTAPPRLAPGVRSDDLLAWTHGQLAFRDAPLSEVALELSRWYGLQVSISDPSLATRTLSARFAGESPDIVLSVIARTLGISYELEGRRVTFHARPR